MRPRTLTPTLIALALVLAVAAPAAAQQEAVTHEFQITLVRASAGPHRMPETIDADATRALEDLVDLLPYSAFDIIDTSRVRTHEGARVRLGEAGAFEVSLFCEPTSAGGRITIGHFEVHQRAIKDQDQWIYVDPENLLATSFAIDPGETVVVGTSRVMYEDEAIIVLLKAIR
jgi:hypothetical protein